MATVQQQERRFRAVEVIKRRIAAWQDGSMIQRAEFAWAYGTGYIDVEKKIAQAEQELQNIAGKRS